MEFLLVCKTCNTKRRIDMKNKANTLQEAKELWKEIKELVNHFCTGDYEIMEIEIEKDINRSNPKDSLRT